MPAVDFSKLPWLAALLTAVASAARTSSANGTTVTDYGPVTRIRAQLECTAASGTTPTLDVVIEDTIDGTNFNTIGTFAELGAAGREAIEIPGPFSDKVRARWTITGTTPSFTFAVDEWVV